MLRQQQLLLITLYETKPCKLFFSCHSAPTRRTTHERPHHWTVLRFSDWRVKIWGFRDLGLERKRKRKWVWFGKLKVWFLGIKNKKNKKEREEQCWRTRKKETDTGVWTETPFLWNLSNWIHHLKTKGAFAFPISINLIFFHHLLLSLLLLRGRERGIQNFLNNIK